MALCFVLILDNFPQTLADRWALLDTGSYWGKAGKNLKLPILDFAKNPGLTRRCEMCTSSESPWLRCWGQDLI